MNDNLIKQSLRLGLSALITCAIALYFDRIEFVWYPLLAVIFVVDDQDENTFNAARGRILGTVCGGLIVFVVHTILSGWIGILVSLLITVPVLRSLGWTGGLSTAVVITVIFLGIKDYTQLDWNYILNRSIDTLIGIFVALVTSRLLWPRNRLLQMEVIHQKLMHAFTTRMHQHSQTLQGRNSIPPPLQPGSVTKDILEIQRLLNIEKQRSPQTKHQILKGRWEQRISIWRALHSHWLLAERLLEAIELKHNYLFVPELATYLDPQNNPGWQKLQIREFDSVFGAPQRILLEEECTRVIRLIRSQKMLDQVLAGDQTE